MSLNSYYVSFNFVNNIYMLGAHFMYVTLPTNLTTCTCFWVLSAVHLDPCYHPTRYPTFQCHNGIIQVLWLGIIIMFQLHYHRETACHSQPSVMTTWQTGVGGGPYLTAANSARQDMCQVTLYSNAFFFVQGLQQRSETICEVVYSNRT